MILITSRLVTNSKVWRQVYARMQPASYHQLRHHQLQLSDCPHPCLHLTLNRGSIKHSCSMSHFQLRWGSFPPHLPSVPCWPLSTHLFPTLFCLWGNLATTTYLAWFAWSILPQGWQLAASSSSQALPVNFLTQLLAFMPLKIIRQSLCQELFRKITSLSQQSSMLVSKFHHPYLTWDGNTATNFFAAGADVMVVN